MKVFIIGAIILMGWMANAQASLIVLNDGRSINGKITHQDNTKIVVFVGANALTYYIDDIVSVDGEPLMAGGKDIGTDPQKDKLIEQYMELMPIEDSALYWTRDIVPADKKKYFLSYLKDNKVIPELNNIRRKWLIKYFSSDVLKAANNFFSSPEGKEFVADVRLYSAGANSPLRKLIRDQAKIAMKKVKS